MRPRVFRAMFWLFAALFFAAGCDLRNELPVTAEVEDPDYRRGTDMMRQGRYQEAVGLFQQVLEKRGLNKSPETHLQLGLLYQQHIHDPVTAIYHFKKYRELKPNNPQTEFDKLVRQRIDAATREFASTLPGPSLNSSLGAADMSDVVRSQEREIEQLRGLLTAARMAASSAARPAPEAAVTSPIGAGESSPVSPVSSMEEAVVVAPPIAQENPAVVSPTMTARTTPLPGMAPNAAPLRPSPAPAAGGRIHVVTAQEKTLMAISRRYYGTPSRWREIQAANHEVLKGGDALQLGMQLRIP